MGRRGRLDGRSGRASVGRKQRCAPCKCRQQNGAPRMLRRGSVHEALLSSWSACAPEVRYCFPDLDSPAPQLLRVVAEWSPANAGDRGKPALLATPHASACRHRRGGGGHPPTRPAGVEAAGRERATALEGSWWRKLALTLFFARPAKLMPSMVFWPLSCSVRGYGIESLRK